MRELETKQLEEISLAKNYTISVEPIKNDKKAKYIFKDDGNVISEYVAVLPLQITPQSGIAREIMKYLDPDNEYRKEKLSSDFDKIKQILHQYYESAKLLATEMENMQQEEKEHHLKEHLKIAEDSLKSLDNPLIWIANIIEWLTAGERNNILLSFVAYAGQIILKNPISVIFLGEGSSGKSHIQEVALDLNHDEFKIYEKKITEAAMFRRAEEDMYFYDGKIVNYGDLGGNNDQDFVMESKNLLKELQSDAFLNKPLNVPDGEGGFIVKDITLKGRPCLTYTTVPGFQFDDQEKSRSIFITPRMDNKVVYNKRQSMLEMKGKTYNQMKKYERESKTIEYMVYHLREALEDITIINPYISLVIDFLSESDYFKRDFDKHNGILKTITALNFYNKTVHETDKSKKVIYVSLSDVQLFFSLLRPYHESIMFNISPKAVDILSDLRENISKWNVLAVDEEKYDNQGNLIAGVSNNDYFEKSETKLSKRSVRRYFNELSSEGFIKVIAKKSQTNIWGLTGKVSNSYVDDLLELDEEAVNSISYELGEDIKDIILNNELVDGLNVLLSHDCVDIPPWNRFDKEEYKIKKFEE